MKIIQVNCVYQKGSTGKIVYDIHNCLVSKGIESIVCYGRGANIVVPNVYKFCSELESKVYHLMNKFGWLMYAVCPIATARLINIIKNEKPDIVHLHCINGYCVDIYKLLKFLGKSGIKTIITHHAEFLYTGNCGHAYDCTKFQHNPGCYDCKILREATGTNLVDHTNRAWRLMKNAYSYFKRENLVFTAVSPWVVARAAQSQMCNSFNCKFVTNGVDTSVFCPSDAKEVERIKERINSAGKKIILHVAASFSSQEDSFKGGHIIKHLAEKMPDYQFVVVASYIVCIEGLPKNVLVWGRSNGQKELATLYSAASVTVIASKRETFSMITAESLCCGTPVVGFVAGGPESIGLKDYTSFVPYGNEDKLKLEIERFVSEEWDSALIFRQAKCAYSKETMTSGYLEIYNDIIK